MVVLTGGFTVKVVVCAAVLVVASFMTGGVAVMVVVVTETVFVLGSVTVVTLTVFFWSCPGSRRPPGTVPRTPLERPRRS